MTKRSTDVTLKFDKDEISLIVREVPAYYDVNQLQEIELLTARVFSSLASQESVEWWRQAVECIGSTLFHLLLHKKQLRGAFNAGYKRLSEGTVCPIGLEFGNNHLAEINALTFLPWEFLYAPRGTLEADKGVFLGTDSRFTIYRKISSQVRESKSYLYRGIRMLLIVADAKETPEISIKPLLKLLDDPQGLNARRLYDLEEVENAEPRLSGGMEYHLLLNPDKQDLQTAVGSGHGWDIIHFVGHGGFSRTPGEDSGGGRIALVEDGETTLCSADYFAECLSKPKVGVQQRQNNITDLVVLQTCEGGTGDTDLWSGFRGVASRVAAEGFPAVVAMQHRVQSDTANMFAVTLYKALKNGLPVDEAVQAGRLGLATNGETEYCSRDFASPVLFSSGREIVFFPDAVEFDRLEKRDEPGRHDRTAAVSRQDTSSLTEEPRPGKTEPFQEELQPKDSGRESRHASMPNRASIRDRQTPSPQEGRLGFQSDARYPENDEDRD